MNQTQVELIAMYDAIIRLVEHGKSAVKRQKAGTITATASQIEGIAKQLSSTDLKDL